MSYRTMPSLPSLRAFECVARHGSFKEASKELFVTPGALSQLVKKLEEELDRELFVRGHRNIRLTKDGETLIVGLQRGFSLLKESVDALRHNELEVLNITAPPAIVSKLIIPKLHGFLESHDHLDVRFSMDEVCENYWEKDIDIGIRLATDTINSLSTTMLSREGYVIAASPALIEQYSLELAENIVHAPLIETQCAGEQDNHVSWKNVLLGLGLTDCAHGRKLYFGPHIDKAIDAAVANVGVIISPRRLLDHELANKQLKIVQSKLATTNPFEYQAVCMSEKRHDPNIKAFLSWLRQEFISCTSKNGETFSQSVA